jgi:hypothetical protein
LAPRPRAPTPPPTPAPPHPHPPQPSPSPPKKPRITIGSLEDLYGKGNVNYAKADAYSCPAPGRSALPEEAREELRLRTVLRKPIGAVPVPGVAPRAAAQESVDPEAP